MAAVVSLQNVVNALNEQNQTSNAFLNIKTGETFVVFEDLDDLGDYLDADDDEVDELEDWQKEELKIRRAIEEGVDWKPLPSSYDINEWRMMEAFADDQKDDSTRDALFDAIHERGAFRRFKEVVHRRGIEQQWYRFRDDRYKEIAVEWLNDNGLQFNDDVARNQQAP